MTRTKKEVSKKALKELRQKMNKAKFVLKQEISFPAKKQEGIIKTMSKPRISLGGNTLRKKKMRQLKTLLKEGRTLGNIDRKNPNRIMSKLKQYAYAYMSETEVRRKINLVDIATKFSEFKIGEYLKWGKFQYWKNEGFGYYSNKSNLNINGLSYRLPIKMCKHLDNELKSKGCLNIFELEEIIKALSSDRYNGYPTDEFIAMLGFSEDSIRKALKRNLVYRTTELRNNPQHKHSGIREILGLNSISPQILDLRLGNVTQSFKFNINKRITQKGGHRTNKKDTVNNDMDILE